MDIFSEVVNYILDKVCVLFLILVAIPVIALICVGAGI